MASRKAIINLHKFNAPSESIVRFTLAGLLIALAILLRLLPHPDNFTPIAAVALFGGALLPWRWGLSLPLLAMIISDLVIGLHPLILYTWGSFALIALLGHYFIKQVKPALIIGASLGASSLFFLISNFGVWLEGKLYPPTLTGLVECYYNALPFFRNTLLGDLFFSGVLFGTYALAYKFTLTRLNTIRA